MYESFAIMLNSVYSFLIKIKQKTENLTKFTRFILFYIFITFAKVF